MGGQPNEPFTDWVPYEPDGDVLDGHISYKNVRIQDIPPTQFDTKLDAPQNPAPRIRQTAASEKEKTELTREFPNPLADDEFARADLTELGIPLNGRWLPKPDEDFVGWDEEGIMFVMLRAKQLITELPSSHMGCFTEAKDIHYQLQLPQLSQKADCQLTWLHLPSSYGLFIFSLLNGVSQESRISRLTVATPVIDMGINPHTSPHYASNLGSLPESLADGLGRQVYMVVPILILQDKATFFRVGIVRRAWKPDIRVRGERTLDESYFPTLSFASLWHRNQNQVVSRESELGTPILTVNNLWIWRCGNGLLTTYAASPNCSWREWPEHWDNASWGPGIQAGLIIAHQILEFGSFKFFEPTFDIFECSVVRILEEVDKYVSPESTLRPQMEKERDFIFRISDIREELVMIQEILGQQLEVVGKMIEDFEMNDPDIKKLLTAPLDENDEKLRAGKRAWETVKEVRDFIERHQKKGSKIDADAERVEKMIQNQLNLKRTHASFEDARTSLLLGTAVIGFTVITIIFAPLAFVTALFALPIDILVRNQVLYDPSSADSSTIGEAEPIPTYPSRYIGRWFVLAEIVSLGVTVFLVWVCLRLFGGKEISNVLEDRVKKTMGGLNKSAEKIVKSEIATGIARGGKGLRNGATKLVQRRNHRQNPSDEV
ncbi:hypothetical protein GGR57DRAFT_499270 [Xylariaceae sp. FL1272]|nr:hypothetical protein GGR57DRAFT_499270 [Xylariaceae sp. FL1272]